MTVASFARDSTSSAERHLFSERTGFLILTPGSQPAVLEAIRFLVKIAPNDTHQSKVNKRCRFHELVNSSAIEIAQHHSKMWNFCFLLINHRYWQFYGGVNK